MKVSWRQHQGQLVFSFDPETGDVLRDGHVRMFRHHCALDMPSEWDAGHTHPDLLATAAFLAVRPFVGPRVLFPIGISAPLATAMRVAAGPIDPALDPRPVPAEGTPALAYSGGVDSTAALTLLPPQAEPVHLLRVVPPSLAWAGRAGHVLSLGRLRSHSRFRSEAALAAVEAAGRLGRTTQVVPTDLEFLRRPFGFPVDIANAVPALLLADLRHYDSIAFGTVMESAYSVGRTRFTDYAQRDHYRQYRVLLNAVGVPLHQVTAGISEVGTTRLVSASEFAGVAQSCNRGRPGEPCLGCYKCFRKTLLAAAMGESGIDNSLADRLLAIPEARAQMRKPWMKHENVLAYATRHYDGDHHLLRLLRRRVRGDQLRVRWMERWYPPAADLLPAHRRDEAVASIRRAMRPMNPAQQEVAESWDLAAALKTPEYRRRRARLIAALDQDEA